MTAPEHQATSLDANARGIIVLVVAVAIGLLLLVKAGGDDTANAGTNTTPPGSTAPLGETTTTSPTTGGTGTGAETTTTEATTVDGTARPPADVQALVLNASGIGGAASAISESLASAGYPMGSADDADADVDGPTVIYYAEGFEADAVAVMGILGKGTTSPKPAEDLGPGAADANVVVVLGLADTVPPG